MSLIDLDKFTIEELCKVFEEDGIKVSKSMATKAKKGQSTSMVSIANKYMPKHMYEKALGWHLLAADKGNIDALLQVGHHYHKGQGVDQDYLISMDWFLKYIAQSRSTNVSIFIADMFEQGHGVPVNKVKAHEWKQCSEDQTYAFMLGVAAGLPKEKKSLDVLLAETQEIVRIEKEKRTGNNGSNVLLDAPEPITIDSPPPSSSSQLHEQPKPVKQRKQQQQQQQSQYQSSQPIRLPLKLQQLEQKQHESSHSSRVQKETPLTYQSATLPHSTSNSHIAQDTKDQRIKYLEDTNFHLLELMRAEKQEKGEMYSTMRSRIISLEEENRDMKKKIEEVQLSHQNLSVLLEQERRIRKNDMELADQERQKIMKRN